MAIEKAVEHTIDSGVRTGDIGGQTGTKEFGDEVVKNMRSILGLF